MTRLRLLKMAILTAAIVVAASIAIPRRATQSSKNAPTVPNCRIEIRGLTDLSTQLPTPSIMPSDTISNVVLELIGEAGELSPEALRIAIDSLPLSRERIERFEYVTTPFGRRMIISNILSDSTEWGEGEKRFTAEYHCSNGMAARTEKRYLADRTPPTINYDAESLTVSSDAVKVFALLVDESGTRKSVELTAAPDGSYPLLARSKMVLSYQATDARGNFARLEPPANQERSIQEIRKIEDAAFQRTLSQSLASRPIRGPTSESEGETMEVQSINCNVPYQLIVPYVYHTSDDGFEANNLMVNRTWAEQRAATLISEIQSVNDTSTPLGINRALDFQLYSSAIFQNVGVTYVPMHMAALPEYFQARPIWNGTGFIYQVTLDQDQVSYQDVIESIGYYPDAAPAVLPILVTDRIGHPLSHICGRANITEGVMTLTSTISPPGSEVACPNGSGVRTFSHEMGHLGGLDHIRVSSIPGGADIFNETNLMSYGTYADDLTDYQAKAFLSKACDTQFSFEAQYGAGFRFRNLDATDGAEYMCKNGQVGEDEYCEINSSQFSNCISHEERPLPTTMDSSVCIKQRDDSTETMACKCIFPGPTGGEAPIPGPASPPTDVGPNEPGEITIPGAGPGTGADQCRRLNETGGQIACGGNCPSGLSCGVSYSGGADCSCIRPCSAVNHSCPVDGDCPPETTCRIGDDGSCGCHEKTSPPDDGGGDDDGGSGCPMACTDPSSCAMCASPYGMVHAPCIDGCCGDCDPYEEPTGTPWEIEEDEPTGPIVTGS